jgi:branched-chain amino acid transport system substrate-binding protein
MKHASIGVAVLAVALGSASAAWADIKIGVAGPITGPNASFGAQLIQGAEQAAADINAAGGILGEKIVLVPGDDVSDPRQGVAVANKFASSGVKFVVGHFNSGVSIPTSDIYADAGILQITPASTNPNFTERKLWNVFRTCGRDDQQGLVAANYILANHKGKKIAVIHDKTSYGKGLADETKKNLNAAGVQEVIYEGVNAGDKDFSPLISKLKAAGVDFLYWGGLHVEFGLIIRQAAEQGLKFTGMGADGTTSDELATIAGPALEGAKMTFPPDPRNRPEAADVVKRFVEGRKFNPEAYTLYSYAAVQVLKQAIEQAGTVDPEKAAKKMHEGGTYKTVIGDISYDAKGDRKNVDYVTYTWKKGDKGTITYLQD